jgi:TonB-linked SusC/RagA family outer membrane protein
MLFLGRVFISAQVDISGTVSDATGQALPAVNVLIKGTTTGAVTNLNGEYNITVPGTDAILVFSFVGYLKQEIGVENQIVINVTLQEDILGLEEVVVVGYGTQRKIDLTGAVSTMNSEDISAIPTPNFEEGMQGKIPGMEMKKTSAEPGGGITVKIRGTNSLMGNNEPLYVIDGFPLINDNMSRPGGWEGQSPLNLLSNLNPNDIESIQVLKDASATAIYGSRGANGVIIITTKKGRPGQAMVDFEYSHTWSKARNPFELCNVEQYARIENEHLYNIRGVTTPDYRYVAADSNAFNLDTSPDQLAAIYGEGTDWLDEILRTGHVNIYNFSVMGGDNRTTYLISTNYYDEKGIILESNYKRGTVRANISSQILERLKVGINMSASRYTADRFTQHGRMLGGGPDRLGVITEAFRANPMTTPETPHLEPNDLLQLEPGQGATWHSIYNPVQQIQKVDNTDAMNFFIGSLDAEVTILDGLKVVFRGGYNIQNQERINFMPKSTPVGHWWGAIGEHTFYDRREFVFENYLNFTRTFGGNHSIDATFGYSLELARLQDKSQSGDQYNFDLQGIYGWQQVLTPQPLSVDETQRTLASMYGRLFYNYGDRYLVTFTARRDGSSVFAVNNKWSFFPSGAVAWVLSEESFMSGLSWLSNLKLRGSYGYVGNQAIAPYQSLAKIRSFATNNAGYVFGVTKQSGLLPYTPANPDLIWETTQQLNVGIDASFSANRVRISADFYKKNTLDLLQHKEVTIVTGYETFTSNFGEISNTGIEIMVGGSPLTGTLKWNSNLTWSFNRNRVEDLGTDDKGNPLEFALPPNAWAGSGAPTMFVVGEPIGTFWGRKWLGNLSQEDVDAGVPVVPGLDEPGDMKFLDHNGDGQITDDDAHPIGNAQPDFIFGWDNTFSYRNFTLNVFINGVAGGKMMNTIKAYTETGNIRLYGGRPSKEYAENHWTPQNTDTRFPRPGGSSLVYSTYYLEDASFVRLSTATLEYMIPGLTWIRNAAVYVRGSNLFVITNYSGFDPEGQFNGQSYVHQNIDLGNYPRPWTVELGVRLGF